MLHESLSVALHGRAIWPEQRYHIKRMALLTSVWYSCRKGHCCKSLSGGQAQYWLICLHLLLTPGVRHDTLIRRDYIYCPSKAWASTANLTWCSTYIKGGFGCTEIKMESRGGHKMLCGSTKRTGRQRHTFYRRIYPEKYRNNQRAVKDTPVTPQI